MTLSLAKVEYVAAKSVACQKVCIRRMLKYLLQEKQEPTTVFYENISTIVVEESCVS